VKSERWGKVKDKIKKLNPKWKPYYLWDVDGVYGLVYFSLYSSPFTLHSSLEKKGATP